MGACPDLRPRIVRISDPTPAGVCGYCGPAGSHLVQCDLSRAISATVNAYGQRGSRGGDRIDAIRIAMLAAAASELRPHDRHAVR